jgi:hypothetical protein
MTLSEQIDRLVSENQHLRVKSDNDDITRRLLKEQYEALAGSVEGIKAKHDREMHILRTERDQAVIAFKEIDTLLLQAADMIMQALRAREGDSTPEHMPEVRGRTVNDDRLPIARLS